MATISYRDIIGPAYYGAWNDFYRHRYSTMCFSGGRGCVDGDTLIDTPSGQTRIRDFRGGLVYSYDGNARVEAIACRPLRYTKEKLYRVTLKNGTSVLCTDEHRFLTLSGWKMEKDLSVGEKIAFFDQQSTLHPVDASSPCPALVDALPHGRRLTLHWMRALLGWIYHYWLDFRHCDGFLPKEEETYIDVLRLLSVSREHVAGRHMVGRASGPCDDRGFHALLLAMGDCLAFLEGRRREPVEGEAGQSLFNLLSQTCSQAVQSRTREALSRNVRLIAGLLLSAAERPVSSADDPAANPSLQMLFAMLRQPVNDASLSDSFLADGKHVAMQEVASIAFEKEDYYYDFFVPFYNNYVSNGIVNHNSLKSSFISIAIILGLERDAAEAFAKKKAGETNWRHYLTHAIAYRKTFSSQEMSCYSQFVWAISKLGLESEYECKKSPLKIVKRSTGQMILFRGLDDPLKSKSIRCPFSFLRYCWFEEAAEFDGIEEIRNVRQSVQRGGHDFVTFYSYNPPETSACWVNYEMKRLTHKDPSFKHYHTDYRSVPIDWLGSQFFAEADLLHSVNERAYRHEYLGEITGNGGTVFPNVRAVELTDEEISHFDHIHWGCDFGTVDPTVLIGLEYERVNHRIILFSEVYESNMLLDRMEELFKAHYFGHEWIRADCAAKQMIMELENRGLPMLGAQKGADSIMHGVKFLQNLKEICIDINRCPKAYEEFTLYEYEKLKGTNDFTSRLPDRMNHAIDSCVIGNTLVHTPDGTIPIRELVGKDGFLLGYCGDGIVRPVPFVHCRKTRENTPTISVSFENGEVGVTCTEDHRILTPDGYVPAGELKPGEEVVARDGVRRISRIDKGDDEDVYDLEVPSTHNFIVNGGLVIHNCRYAIEDIALSSGLF